MKTPTARTEQLPGKAHKYLHYNDPSQNRVSL